MRSLGLIAVLLAIAPFTGSAARAEGQWCAYYRQSGTNCGFHSFAQCLATISGVGGDCLPNPNYRPHSRS
jgi:hypothetical protein